MMWIYYRDHRATLIEETKEFRNEILSALIAGTSPEDVFAPYVIQETSTKPSRGK
jgi:hypothetical protein